LIAFIVSVLFCRFRIGLWPAALHPHCNTL
jgi:hypothetical protein